MVPSVHGSLQKTGQVPPLPTQSADPRERGVVDPEPATRVQASSATFALAADSKPLSRLGHLPGKNQALSPPRLTHSAQPVSWHKAAAVPSPRPDILAGPRDGLPGRMQDTQRTLDSANYFLARVPPAQYLVQTYAKKLFI